MGPVQFLVLTFPGASPGTGAVGALGSLRRSGAVNVIDTLLVAKDKTGTISWRELADVPELSSMVQRDQVTLIDAEDAEEAGQLLELGTCAVLALVEQLWAADAARAVREAGGELAISVPIPADVVDAALELAEVPQ
jgi:hypothetical protein